MYTISNETQINSTSYILLLSNNDFSLASSYNLIRCILLLTVFIVIIFGTIVGNVFVISAVAHERNLHSVANYLIVSLATTDLMVAIMVMPLSAYQDIVLTWQLGKIICDLWTILDVLCCTASILHLVAIALDRYLAITSIKYGAKRTKKRIITIIACIWALSTLISLLPHILLLENEYIGKCRLTDNFLFQIFSTIGAFYLPLIVMCIIYWNIFQSAKFRIRKKAFKKSENDENGLNLCKRLFKRNSKQTEAHSTQITLTEIKQKSSIDLNSNKKGHIAESTKHDHAENSLVKTQSFDDLLKHQVETTIDARVQLQKNEHNSTSTSPPSPVRHESRVYNTGGGGGGVGGEISVSSTHAFTHHKSQKKKKRNKIDIKRERKAAKTLGIIMTCFIVCWLPFFIMQLIFSLCKSCTDLLGESILVTILTWLGYSNSLLNPVIYTIFSPDFRGAFSKMFVRIKRR